jgi:hypothetical protein
MINSLQYCSVRASSEVFVMNNQSSIDPLAHLRPALFAAYRADIPVALVGRGPHSFKPAVRTKAFFAVLCDDTGVALGPVGFHHPSLMRLLGRADTVIIHAWALEPLIYSAAVCEAIFLRRNVVVVETRLSHEQKWISLVGRMKKPRLVITTPVGGAA